MFQIKDSKDISKPNEPKIMQWMAKSRQALSEETRRLSFNERGICTFKALQLHKSIVATSNPNKNGLSSPLSWRAQACKWKKWKRKRYKEEDEVVPTNPSTPPCSQNEFSCASHCQKSFSLENPKEIGLILPHQHKCRSAPSPHRSVSKKCEPIRAQCWLLALSAQKCEKMALNLEFWRCALENARGMRLSLEF